MKYTPVLFAFTLIASMLGVQSTSAEDAYFCTFGPHERVLSLVYPKAEQSLPCEVHYEREGVTEVLWRSEHTQGFCRTKIDDFLQKQRGVGWRCAKQGPAITLEDSQFDAYVLASHVGQALSMASSFKVLIMEHRMMTGEFPTSLEDVGLAADSMTDSAYFSNLTIDDEGSIYVQGNVNWGWASVIALSPVDTLGGVATEWRCAMNIHLPTYSQCEFRSDLRFPDQ